MLLRALFIVAALLLWLAQSSQAAVFVAAPASLPPTPENAYTAFLEDGPESRIGLLCHNDPVNKTDPTGLITLVFPGFGPQRSGSNESFIEKMKEKFKDAVVFSRSQAGQAKAVEAVKQAIKNGDKTVNVAGYSRGAIGAIQAAGKLGKEGISVDRLVTVDPVTVTGNNGTVAVPSNVQRADNSFQRGARMGITDFPGTALAPAPNVHNTFYRDGVANGYNVRHENMPGIAEGD